MAKIVSINRFILLKPHCSVQKYFFVKKPRFLLYIDLSGIINCNTFSVVPSIINENEKKRAVPFDSNGSHRFVYRIHEFVQILMNLEVILMFSLSIHCQLSFKSSQISRFHQYFLEKESHLNRKMGSPTIRGGYMDKMSPLPLSL